MQNEDSWEVVECIYGRHMGIWHDEPAAAAARPLNPLHTCHSASRLSQPQGTPARGRKLASTLGQRKVRPAFQPTAPGGAAPGPDAWVFLGQEEQCSDHPAALRSSPRQLQARAKLGAYADRQPVRLLPPGSRVKLVDVTSCPPTYLPYGRAANGASKSLPRGDCPLQFMPRSPPEQSVVGAKRCKPVSPSCRHVSPLPDCLPGQAHPLTHPPH